jgi:hypothetical protein
MGDWSTITVVVMRSAPSTFLHEGCGGVILLGILVGLARLVERLERAKHHVMDKRGFPGAGDAGDHDHHAEGDLDLDVFQVMHACAGEADHAPGIDRTARARQRDPQIAAQITRRERAIAGSHQVGQWPFEDDVSAVLTGSGAEIDDVVRGAHDVGVVLHHDDGVTQFAEFHEDADEAARVAAVQPDGGLIEHIAGAYEAGTQRGGELDALRFAARECGREPVEREVVQADVVEELQALADFDQDLFGDGGLFGTQLQAIEKALRFRDVHAVHVAQILAAHLYVEGILAQAGALALGTQRIAAITAEEDTHVELVLLGFQVIEEAADEFVDGFAFDVGEVAERRHQSDAAVRMLLEVAEPGAELGLGPRVHGAILEGQRLVGDDAIHVEIDGVAEALAAGAGAGGGIKAEQDRIGDGEFLAAGLALELFVEAQAFGGRGRTGAFEDNFARLAEADLDGIDEALMQVGLDGETVHQHEERFREVDIEQRFRCGELKDAARLKEAVEAFLAQFEQVVAKGLHGSMIARRENRVPAGTRGQSEQAGGDFVYGVFTHTGSALGTECLTHAGVEEAEKVEALGGGGDGGSRVAAGVFLADGDGGGDAVDFVDLGLLHTLQELAGVGGERFDVAALPLSVDGVEG